MLALRRFQEHVPRGGQTAIIPRQILVFALHEIQAANNAGFWNVWVNQWLFVAVAAIQPGPGCEMQVAAVCFARNSTTCAKEELAPPSGSILKPANAFSHTFGISLQPRPRAAEME